jgi:mRNA-degrading endonuclease toxin of MazEF toxin-antitoxin module
VVRGDYVPERGGAVCIQFNSQAGHEQAGRRPALVLSPAAYNGKVGLAILCPVTSQEKGYPFEVRIPEGRKDVVQKSRVRPRRLYRCASALPVLSSGINCDRSIGS